MVGKNWESGQSSFHMKWHTHENLSSCPTFYWQSPLSSLLYAYKSHCLSQHVPPDLAYLNHSIYHSLGPVRARKTQEFQMYSKAWENIPIQIIFYFFFYQIHRNWKDTNPNRSSSIAQKFSKRLTKTNFYPFCLYHTNPSKKLQCNLCKNSSLE